MIASTIATAWRVYREHFSVIAAVVIVVWLPCDLLSSYMAYFVFDSDDVLRSVKFDRFLDNFIGIIATAGVTFIAMTARAGESPTFGSAIGAGFGSWGRMWWTRFLSTLFIVVGLLLLVVPGIYLATRLCFAESIAVVERISGSKAMARSFALTKNRFWKTFLFGLTLIGLVLVVGLVLFIPAAFVPALDHWLIDAAFTLAYDVLAAFFTVAWLCGYQVYSRASEAEVTGELRASSDL